MILKETILSAFTERGTLLKWLKKVEAALNNAVLSDVSVETISETEIKLKFTFEDGNFIESPILTLPRGLQGETGATGATGATGEAGADGLAATIQVGSVTTGAAGSDAVVENVGTENAAILNFVIPKGEQGADGLDGEGIAATVEVGTVTTGAAGTDASVTNVGTEQRAVLNFVIPRGDTGASGEEGSAGVGFDDASNVEIFPTPALTSVQNGFELSGTMKVTAGEEIYEIPSTMILPLTSNGSIIIDVAEDGRSVEIHLDAEILAKINRALLLPISAPESISLVAVDTNNAQSMLTLGNGLSVSGGVLSASGGGGGGSAFEYVDIRFYMYDGGGYLKGGTTRILVPYIAGASPNTLADYIAKVGMVTIRDTDHSSYATIGQFILSTNSNGKCTYQKVSGTSILQTAVAVSCKINSIDVTDSAYVGTTMSAGDIVEIELYFNSGN